MTVDSTMFVVVNKKKGSVTFVGNQKGKIVGIANIGNCFNPIIENVLLVEGLNHNLLSISQLCDKGYEVIFKSNSCIIKDASNGKTLFTAYRKENIYIIDLDIVVCNDEKCFAANSSNDCWIWHRRLGVTPDFTDFLSYCAKWQFGK